MDHKGGVFHIRLLDLVRLNGAVVDKEAFRNRFLLLQFFDWTWCHPRFWPPFRGGTVRTAVLEFRVDAKEFPRRFTCGRKPPPDIRAVKLVDLVRKKASFLLIYCRREVSCELEKQTIQLAALDVAAVTAEMVFPALLLLPAHVVVVHIMSSWTNNNSTSVRSWSIKND